MLYINSKFFLIQVTNVSFACLDNEIITEKMPDLINFSRRLNDYQILSLHSLFVNFLQSKPFSRELSKFYR